MKWGNEGHSLDDECVDNFVIKFNYQAPKRNGQLRGGFGYECYDVTEKKSPTSISAQSLHKLLNCFRERGLFVLYYLIRTTDTEKGMEASCDQLKHN